MESTKGIYSRKLWNQKTIGWCIYSDMCCARRSTHRRWQAKVGVLVVSYQLLQVPTHLSGTAPLYILALAWVLETMHGYAKSLGENWIPKILRSSCRLQSIVMKTRAMFTLSLVSQSVCLVVWRTGSSFILRVKAAEITQSGELTSVTILSFLSFPYVACPSPHFRLFAPFPGTPSA